MIDICQKLSAFIRFFTLFSILFLLNACTIYQYRGRDGTTLQEMAKPSWKIKASDHNGKKMSGRIFQVHESYMSITTRKPFYEWKKIQPIKQPIDSLKLMVYTNSFTGSPLRIKSGKKILRGYLSKLSDNGIYLQNESGDIKFVDFSEISHLQIRRLKKYYDQKNEQLLFSEVKRYAVKSNKKLSSLINYSILTGLVIVPSITAFGMGSDYGVWGE